jgi:outer membrane lipoprotein SlyB
MTDAVFMGGCIFVGCVLLSTASQMKYRSTVLLAILGGAFGAWSGTILRPGIGTALLAGIGSASGAYAGLKVDLRCKFCRKQFEHFDDLDLHHLNCQHSIQ